MCITSFLEKKQPTPTTTDMGNMMLTHNLTILPTSSPWANMRPKSGNNMVANIRPNMLETSNKRKAAAHMSACTLPSTRKR